MIQTLKTLIKLSTERIKNPLIGSFFISWIVINWKPILFLLFTNETMLSRINFVENNYASVLSQLIYPLSFSLFYITALPYIQWGLEIFSYNANIGRQKKYNQFRISKIIDEQFVVKEEVKLEDIRANYKEKSDLNNRISELISIVDEKDKELDRLKSLIKNKDKEFDELINSINSSRNTNGLEQEYYDQEYQKFAKQDIYNYFEEVATSISKRGEYPISLRSIIIEKFKYSDLFKEVFDETTGRHYIDFTEKGEIFWKKYLEEL